MADAIHINKQEYSHESYFSIFPYQKIRRKYDINLEKREHYELISDIKIYSTNLFGTENFNEITKIYEEVRYSPKEFTKEDFKQFRSKVHFIQS